MFLEHPLRSSIKALELILKSTFFSGVSIVGAGSVWQDDFEAELQNLKRSSPKHALYLEKSKRIVI